MPYGQLFDSTSAADIPADAKQVAGYLDGQWPSYKDLLIRFPHAQHLSITVEGDVRADCADVEEGAMSPGQLALWVGRKLHLHTQPRAYCSLSLWPQCIDTLAAAGLRGGVVMWWIAHWTGHAHRINGAAAVQYASPTVGLPPGHHYDVSQILRADFMPRLSHG